MLCLSDVGFESFVNSERCKTFRKFEIFIVRLRALLIQKDAKLVAVFLYASTV